jgi:hypothetical protein
MQCLFSTDNKRQGFKKRPSSWSKPSVAALSNADTRSFQVALGKIQTAMTTLSALQSSIEKEQSSTNEARAKRIWQIEYLLTHGQYAFEQAAIHLEARSIASWYEGLLPALEWILYGMIFATLVAIFIVGVWPSSYYDPFDDGGFDAVAEDYKSGKTVYELANGK